MSELTVWIDKLEGLGSAYEIAAFLEANNITGLECNAARCPVSNFLKEETGIRVSVSSERILGLGFSDAPDEEIIPLKNVVTFINSFDSGMYPKLVRYEDE